MAALSGAAMRLASGQTQVTWLTVIGLVMACCSAYLLYAPLGYVSGEGTVLDRMTAFVVRHRIAAYAAAVVALAVVGMMVWGPVAGPLPLWGDAALCLVTWAAVAVLALPTMHDRWGRR